MPRIRRLILTTTMLLLPTVAGAQDLNEEFFAAARKGDTSAVKSLLDRGVDVNAKTRYGATALSYACDRGNVEMIKLLLDRGADVNVRDTFYGEVPLGWALSKGNAEVVKLLLDKGAAGIERALTTGVQSGNVEIVKVVLDKGGLKPETLNNALIRASSAGNKEIIDLLKKAGAVSTEFNIEPAVLNSYAGQYKSEQIGDLVFEVKDGRLRGKLSSQGWFTTSAQSKTTFAILEVDATITFNTEAEKVTGFTLKQGGGTFVFKRLEVK